MNKFEMTVSMGNSAFEHDPEGELFAILTIVKTHIADGLMNGFCRDHKGNVVGDWKIT